MEQPSSSWLPSTNSTFWPNGRLRKRKAAATDLDEKTNTKIFVTEEKMVKDLRTLSLDLEEKVSPPIDDEGKSETLPEVESLVTSHVEFHPLLQDSLKNDDLQDPILNKLCELERRKFTMQLVPYMPIHPAQLFTQTTTSTDEDETEEKSSSPSPVSDEHLFKKPSLPTAYTVEEPNEGGLKRSFSQCNRYNPSLSVTEMKYDSKDDSAIPHSSSTYCIVEPAVSPSRDSSSIDSMSSGPSVRITEYLENPSDLVDDDDDIDMQSVASSDTGDKMDDD